jgi:hydroxyacyl-ACP dehydratase HTD2-like protein with hotdog domain
VDEKEGRSGRLLIVTVHHDYSQNGSIVVEEQQDLVYREPPPPGTAKPSPAGAELPESTWSRRQVVNEPLLARYSAVTFNAHRIHYDLRYAVEVEGYQGLVVHGPLLATMVASAAVEHSGLELASIEYRGMAPAFCPDELVTVVDAVGDTLEAAIHRSDGNLAMRATVGLRV